MAILSYAYLYEYDNDLFTNLNLPTQLSDDSDTVIENILWKSFELEALYPDPDWAKGIIGVWSAARLHAWQRIADALYNTYDPFVNFTRDETRRTEYRPNLTNTQKGSGRGFNSATMVQRDESELKQTGNAATIETFHSEGDSPLHTPTDVAEKETNLRAKHDLINIITSEFLNEFCLMIY